MTFNNNIPWATITAVLITIVASVAGAAVVIWGDPGTYSFSNYLDDMKGFVIGIGVLGLGRGINSGLKNHGLANKPTTTRNPK
jgi:hypothetical protein